MKNRFALLTFFYKQTVSHCKNTVYNFIYWQKKYNELASLTVTLLLFNYQHVLFFKPNLYARSYREVHAKLQHIYIYEQQTNTILLCFLDNLLQPCDLYMVLITASNLNVKVAKSYSVHVNQGSPMWCPRPPGRPHGLAWSAQEVCSKNKTS